MSVPNSGTDAYASSFSLDAESLGKQAISAIRIAFGISGVIALVIGVLVLVWPRSTLEVVAFLFGLYFLLAGVVRVVTGIFAKGLSGGMRTLSIILGAILVILGVVALKNPLGSLAALGILIGLGWIIEGIVALAESGNGSSRGLAIFLGVLSLIAGLIVLFVPIATVAILVLIAGISLVILGIVGIIRGFTFGRGVAVTAV